MTLFLTFIIVQILYNCVTGWVWCTGRYSGYPGACPVRLDCYHYQVCAASAVLAFISQIHSHWLGGIKLTSGIGLSYRPATLHRLSGRYDNPRPESTIAPRSGTMNLASVYFYVLKLPLLSSFWLWFIYLRNKKLLGYTVGDDKRII